MDMQMNIRQLVRTATIAQIFHAMNNGQIYFTEVVDAALEEGQDSLLINMCRSLADRDVEYVAGKALEYDRRDLTMTLLHMRPTMDKYYIIEAAERSYNDDLIPEIIDV